MSQSIDKNYGLDESGRVDRTELMGILKLSPEAIDFQNRINTFYNGDIDKYDILNKQAIKLEKKYPDCRKYILFHLMIFSSPPNDCDKYDFPGEDSIVDFISSLETKYGQSQAA